MRQTTPPEGARRPPGAGAIISPAEIVALELGCGVVVRAAGGGCLPPLQKAVETPCVGPQYNAANATRCTAPQKAMFESVFALVVVGGLATGLLRHAMVQMGETEPMSSDNFWVRAPAATAYMACLFTGGYLVYLLLQVLIRVVLG